MNAAIAGRRLWNQFLTRSGPRRPADVVGWFGAMQAQEFEPAKWAIGLRMKEGTADAAIQRAFDEGRILRTHVMRPTWHAVAASDIRWLLELTAPCVRRRMAPYNRHLELDARTMTRAAGVIERSLRGGRHLTRAELRERLRQAGLPMEGQRLAHVMMHAELEAVVCSGPRRGRESTYALIAERAPGAVRMARDEALATLARRFLQSHGPATIRDFVWWSGLGTPDAKRGVEMIGARREEIDGLTYWTAGEPPRGTPLERGAHLLPIYDEYLIAYRDRVAVPHGPASIAAGFAPAVTFQHALLIAGQVAGTWRTASAPRARRIEAVALRRLTPADRRALAEAFGRYQRFVGTPVTFSLAPSQNRSV